MALSKSEKIAKCNQAIKLCQTTLVSNENKLKLKLQAEDKKIFEAKQGMEDCDARIRDCERWLRDGIKPETRMNTSIERYKAKKSKHNANIWRAEQKQYDIRQRFNVAQGKVQERLNKALHKLDQVKRGLV